MALTGNLITYTVSSHPSDTENVIITYPSDLLDDHPNYDLRGTSITESVPVTVETPQEHSGVYVFISAASVQLVGYDSTNQSNNVNLYYIYKVYNTKAEKDAGADPILEDGISAPWDYNSNLNPTEASYIHLKTQKGFENLTNL